MYVREGVCILSSQYVGRGDLNKNLHALILRVCLEMGDLLQAPINTTCNGTGTHYYWCICMGKSVHYVREAVCECICGKGKPSGVCGNGRTRACTN